LLNTRYSVPGPGKKPS